MRIKLSLILLTSLEEIGRKYQLKFRIEILLCSRIGIIISQRRALLTNLPTNGTMDKVCMPLILKVKKTNNKQKFRVL